MQIFDKLKWRGRMLMNVLWLIFLIMMSSNASAYERLSFSKLVTSPEEYEGKKIYLTGYFISDGANCLVISNGKETALMFREYEMVKLCKEKIDRSINSVRFDKLQNRYGSVAGLFSVKKCGDDLKLGSSLYFLGCLTKVVELHGPIYESGPITPPPPIID